MKKKYVYTTCYHCKEYKECLTQLIDYSWICCDCEPKLDIHTVNNAAIQAPIKLDPALHIPSPQAIAAFIDKDKEKQAGNMVEKFGFISNKEMAEHLASLEKGALTPEEINEPRRFVSRSDYIKDHCERNGLPLDSFDNTAGALPKLVFSQLKLFLINPMEDGYIAVVIQNGLLLNNRFFETDMQLVHAVKASGVKDVFIDEAFKTSHVRHIAKSYNWHCVRGSFNGVDDIATMITELCVRD